MRIPIFEAFLLNSGRSGVAAIETWFDWDWGGVTAFPPNFLKVFVIETNSDVRSRYEEAPVAAMVIDRHRIFAGKPQLHCG